MICEIFQPKLSVASRKKGAKRQTDMKRTSSSDLSMAVAILGGVKGEMDVKSGRGSTGGDGERQGAAVEVAQL